MIADVDTRIEAFSSVAFAALCEVGLRDVAMSAPAFLNDDGTPYLEFDTFDYPEGSHEFEMALRAEQLGHQAIAITPATPSGSEP